MNQANQTVTKIKIKCQINLGNAFFDSLEVTESTTEIASIFK